MIISIRDVWADAKQKHAAFLSDVIDQALTKLQKKPELANVVDFVRRNRHVIESDQSKDLIAGIDDFHKAFAKVEDLEIAKKVLKEVFDYDTFIEKPKDDAEWRAYNLCSLARYKFCPYCQLTATDTVSPSTANKQRGYRPSIDHYYPKSKYPFLSLTLGNFIPCCEKCNGSQMKGQKDFYKEVHLNPLSDEESIEFELAIPGQDLIEALISRVEPNRYVLNLRIPGNCKASAASLSTFQLPDRYKIFTQKAVWIARRSRDMPARMENYSNDLDIDIKVEDYLGFRPTQYKGVEQGKMMLCIAKQFGAI